MDDRAAFGKWSDSLKFALLELHKLRVHLHGVHASQGLHPLSLVPRLFRKICAIFRFF